MFREVLAEIDFNALDPECHVMTERTSHWEWIPVWKNLGALVMDLPMTSSYTVYTIFPTPSNALVECHIMTRRS